MSLEFIICALGMIVTIPLHFLSVEHVKLQTKFGQEEGAKMGAICGIVSGWGFFLSWIGLWVSPQPRFSLSISQNLLIQVPFTNISVVAAHLIIFAPLFALGAWFGIKGVREITLKVAEIHRPQKIITTGVYSIVRHPQYLGGLLAHVGISFLLSAWFSLLSTPLVVAIVYLISKKEEEELSREFGEEYMDYRSKVPILLPRLRRQKN